MKKINPGEKVSGKHLDWKWNNLKTFPRQGKFYLIFVESLQFIYHAKPIDSVLQRVFQDHKRLQNRCNKNIKVTFPCGRMIE